MPPTQRASGVVRLRYEDVCQDGRVAVGALPQALGEAVWRPLLSGSPLAKAMRDSGIVPILSRLHVLGADGRVSVRAPLSVQGRYDVVHTVDADGEVDRILLRMWARLSGVSGRTHGPQPEDAGTAVLVGDVYAEHVLSRPFGPAAERKVLRLDAPGVAPVPEQRVVLHPPAELAVLPEDATALDDAIVTDDRGWVFGLDDTDSNRHVNSLVYPRLFREAGLRRLVAHGVSAQLLVRGFAIAYRKPCFAGDRVTTRGRAFRARSGDGTARTTFGFAVCLVAQEAPDDEKAHCFARIVFTD